MKKILGIDMGTNSLGWAVLDERNNNGKEEYELIYHGVVTFSEAVKIEKNIVSSPAAERRVKRGTRRLMSRRRLRKQALLKLLIENQMCPLSLDELKQWQTDKYSYPTSQPFLNWIRSGDPNIDRDTHAQSPPLMYDPYTWRKKAIEERINNYALGRALYHIIQRRGFKSNKIIDEQSTKEEEESNKRVEALDEAMKEVDAPTLGAYYYQLLDDEKKVRSNPKYLEGRKHYEDEIEKICEKQGITNDLKEELLKIILEQRPLKSQKQAVGKCTLEPNKKRCPISHPLFQEFRMLQLLNDLKYKDDKKHIHPLTEEQKQRISSPFYNQKTPFQFEELQKLFDKHYAPLTLKSWGSRSVPNATFYAGLKNALGTDWHDELQRLYKKSDNESKPPVFDDMVDMLWHHIYWHNHCVGEDDKSQNESYQILIENIGKKWDMNEDQLKKIAKIRIDKGYASLSKKAIKKIIIYLRKGIPYTDAVFFANLNALDIKEDMNAVRQKISEIVANHRERNDIIDMANGVYADYKKASMGNDPMEKPTRDAIIERIQQKYGSGVIDDWSNEKLDYYVNQFNKNIETILQKNDYVRLEKLEEAIKEVLRDTYGVSEERLKTLYHPSAIDTFPKRQPITHDGREVYTLGDPRTSSLKNPQVMRVLYQLRRLVNVLLTQTMIDKQTIIRVEMARELNSINEREGIRKWQNEREKLREEYDNEIQQTCGRQATETDLLKYELYMEQDRKCIYTGESIGISDFLDDNPSFDIEHTIPQSRFPDNSRENLTLCKRSFNIYKGNRLPLECPDSEELNFKKDEFKIRAEQWYKTKAEEERKQMDRYTNSGKRAKRSGNMDAYKNARKQYHVHKFNKEYWQNKYDNLMLTEIPERFKRSQLAATGQITRFALSYLKSVFDRVHAYKGAITNQYGKVLGVIDEKEKKDRSKHIHHTIDAILVGCMGHNTHQRLCEYYNSINDADATKRNDTQRATELRKEILPWTGFTQEMRLLDKETIVKHYEYQSIDKLFKTTKKKVYHNGKLRRTHEGNVIYQQGLAARGALHQDTFYGVIKRYDINKGEPICVIRKPLAGLTEKQYKNIIDPEIKKRLYDKLQTAAIKDIQEEASNNGVDLGMAYPIKTVRIKAQPTYENSIKLRANSTHSRHEHKQQVIVDNEVNALWALYRCAKPNGKIRYEKEVVNRLDVIQYIHNHRQGRIPKPILQLQKNIGNHIYELYKIVSMGTHLLYVGDRLDDDHAIWTEPLETWQKICQPRLFRVLGIEGDTRLRIIHHIEARSDNQLPKIKDAIKGNIDLNSLQTRYRLAMMENKWLVEHIDFNISETGIIMPIRPSSPLDSLPSYRIFF